MCHWQAQSASAELPQGEGTIDYGLIRSPASATPRSIGSTSWSEPRFTDSLHESQLVSCHHFVVSLVEIERVGGKMVLRIEAMLDPQRPRIDFDFQRAGAGGLIGESLDDADAIRLSRSLAACVRT